MNIPSGWELVLIVLVIVLLFGARKLPDAARGLGRSLRIFKSEVSSLNDDDEKVTPPPAVPPQVITSMPTTPNPMATPVTSVNGSAAPVPPPVEHPVTAPASSDSKPAEPTPPWP
jgi:sec-independent protein translocase protein TatA